MHVITNTIIAIFLCYASIVNAQTNNNQDAIRCPSLDSIHQAALLLNQIEKGCGDGFCVSTGQKPAFHENGVSWGLLVPIKASSKDEAILKSQTIAVNVGVMFSAFIRPMSCIYYVPSSDFSENEVTGVMAFPHHGKNFSSSLIYSFLKSK